MPNKSKHGIIMAIYTIIFVVGTVFYIAGYWSHDVMTDVNTEENKTVELVNKMNKNGYVSDKTAKQVRQNSKITDTKQIMKEIQKNSQSKINETSELTEQPKNQSTTTSSDKFIKTLEEQGHISDNTENQLLNNTTVTDKAIETAVKDINQSDKFIKTLEEQGYLSDNTENQLLNNTTVTNKTVEKTIDYVDQSDKFIKTLEEQGHISSRTKEQLLNKSNITNKTVNSLINNISKSNMLLNNLEKRDKISNRTASQLSNNITNRTIERLISDITEEDRLLIYQENQSSVYAVVMDNNICSQLRNNTVLTDVNKKKVKQAANCDM